MSIPPIVSDDSGEYEEDIRKILNRIPRPWGQTINCDIGWYKLLAEINNKLSLLYPDYEVYQVKEKFGTLRYYFGVNTHGDEITEDENDRLAMLESIMSNVVSCFENRSAHVCEWCGEFGEMRVSNGWYKTLCKDCAKKLNYSTEEVAV